MHKQKMNEKVTDGAKNRTLLACGKHATNTVKVTVQFLLVFM